MYGVKAFLGNKTHTAYAVLCLVTQLCPTL